MSSRYPAPKVMLARLSRLLNVPVVSSDPLFPDEPSRRAEWDTGCKAFVRVSDREPVSCLALGSSGGIVLHPGGQSLELDILHGSGPKRIAEAVWAFEALASVPDTIRRWEEDTTHTGTGTNPRI